MATTKLKWRYFKINLYRLNTRKYNDEWFECEMHEPCFRLIIKDLMKSHGLEKEYVALKLKCAGRNMQVEKAKKELLKSVMKKNGDI